MTDASENAPQEKPELGVDEDWKTKVQAEKEAAEHAAESVPEASADSQPDVGDTEFLDFDALRLMTLEVTLQVLALFRHLRRLHFVMTDATSVPTQAPRL